MFLKNGRILLLKFLLPLSLPSIWKTSAPLPRRVYSWWARKAAERLQNITYWLRHFSCQPTAFVLTFAGLRGSAPRWISHFIMCRGSEIHTESTTKNERGWRSDAQFLPFLFIHVFPVNGVTPSHCWCQRLHSLPKKPRSALNAPVWKNWDLSSFSLADSLILPVALWMSHQEAFCLMQCIM